MDLLTVSIGIGLAVSLLFTELFGLAAGGMVVPGYIALYLDRPLEVAVTVGTGIATYLIVHFLSSMVIIYGKRRTVLMILVGFLAGFLLRVAPYSAFELVYRVDGFQDAEFTTIGYIIPGLIAIWIDRQGLVETVAVLFTASVVVRLILILAFGVEVLG